MQSALIDLRSLVGFVLADAHDVLLDVKGRARGMNVKSADVRPSWFFGTEEMWMPRTRRRRQALYAFYEPVGAHLAHIAVKSLRHPGEWPIKEAMLVVFEDLTSMLNELEHRRLTEACRFHACGDPLRQTLAAAGRINFGPYPPPSAEKSVARARRLLRTQLNWPLT